MTESYSQPNIFGFDPDAIGGPVGADHPATSQVAAMRVKSGSQQAQALLALRQHDAEGLNAYQLKQYVLNGAGEPISANQTATRLGELRGKGLVAYVFDQFGKPVERETTPGNTGYVHRLTKFGQQAALDVITDERDLISDERKKALADAGRPDWNYLRNLNNNDAN